MRFLIDENLSPQICTLLIAGGLRPRACAHPPVEPSVVLLRQLPEIVRAADVAALLLANLTPAVASALDAGAFVVLTPTAVCVRHLPLR